MAKKKAATRRPRTPITVYGPPLGTRLRFVNGDKKSFSYTTDAELPTVEVIAEAVDVNNNPLPGRFTVTNKEQTNGGGIWTVTFEATYNARLKPKTTGSSHAENTPDRPLSAGRLKITIRPTTKKVGEISWMYRSVTYP